MKAIVTGMNGTVAPVLSHYLQERAFDVVRWDRSAVPTDNRGHMESFIEETAPDWLFHLATGSPEWASSVAEICGQRGIGFLFTSSVSVFDGSRSGPFSLEHAPDATDEYGRYKIDCEEKVRAANANAYIARLGWQIGTAVGSNHMVDFLATRMVEDSRISASASWMPSCCFLVDSAKALHEIISKHPPGLYQVEGNPGLSFYEIVTRLNRLHGGTWNVVQLEESPRDGRMVDERLRVPPLTEHLPQ